MLRTIGTLLQRISVYECGDFCVGVVIQDYSTIRMIPRLSDEQQNTWRMKKRKFF